MFPIERLDVGDLIVTQDGRAARIAKTHTAIATELVRIVFSDGTTIHSTPWHRFYNLRGTLIRAEELTPGTISCTHDSSIVTVTRVTKIADGAEHEVYNLSLDRDVSFFANGKLVEAPRASRILNGNAILAAGSL